MRRLAATLGLAAAVLVAHAQPAGVPVPAPALPSKGAPAAAGVKTIAWADLTPKDWDPMKDFKASDLGMLQDGDPKAAALLRRMRDAWDNAPVNATLAGQAVRIPGFVVPLEEGKDGVREFLLVPYFGACIHTPPPPANQIIHVLPKSPARNVKSMDTVWVSGVLSTVKTDSYMGASGYRIEATGVEPYVERVR